MLPFDVLVHGECKESICDLGCNYNLSKQFLMDFFSSGQFDFAIGEKTSLASLDKMLKH